MGSSTPFADDRPEAMDMIIATVQGVAPSHPLVTFDPARRRAAAPMSGCAQST